MSNEKAATHKPNSAVARNKVRRSGVLFWMIVGLAVIHVLQLTGLDGAIPKIIGTVGYWFSKDWETSVRASLGTALFVLFIVMTGAGMYLSKQEEA